MPTAKTRELIAALKKAGGQPKFTEDPCVGHIPEKACHEKELYHWLKEQKKL